MFIVYKSEANRKRSLLYVRKEQRKSKTGNTSKLIISRLHLRSAVKLWIMSGEPARGAYMAFNLIKKKVQTYFGPHSWTIWEEWRRRKSIWAGAWLTGAGYRPGVPGESRPRSVAQPPAPPPAKSIPTTRSLSSEHPPTHTLSQVPTDYRYYAAIFSRLPRSSPGHT